jgi:hypothetical protein
MSAFWRSLDSWSLNGLNASYFSSIRMIVTVLQCLQKTEKTALPSTETISTGSLLPQMGQWQSFFSIR